ncbi:hypothetical protein [Gottfriedia solisilvae]|uniref:Lipoprotein n=1 Tax=Gottfriedia solisilvae TaxID=1516104 RepID=A0A8J3AD09_9BACI|nr:hypothetical protein [Gottfriedia solisilvae]GGI11761.1 hypothetical protein GCM10007380_09460 [Gottfriedia solisilvae]
MKKIFILTLILTVCLITSACVSMNTSNKSIQPKKLDVEQTSKLENWDIQAIPRMDHKKWVYDTIIKFNRDKTVNLTVLNYDKTKIRYEDVKPLIPLKTFGSYDYEESVYSRKNSHLSFTLKWSEGDKIYNGVAKFNVKSQN